MKRIDEIPVWGEPILEAVEQMRKAMEQKGEYCAGLLLTKIRFV